MPVTFPKGFIALWSGVQIPPLPLFLEVLRLKNGGDSLMLQRLLGHTTLMMTNKYCQAVGFYNAIESHKKVFTGG